ncbi:MAG: hypothetical protein EOO88_54500 [Pedobacter sp.]|nr:MAG: hypothetical protein EOO88_54500 [Pedobacter sp.]
MTTYQLSFTFLKQLLEADLLGLTNSIYYKGKRWTAEPDMSLDKFLMIARSGSVEGVPDQVKKSVAEKLPAQSNKPAIKSSLRQVVKPRQNLAMNLKFTKSKQWDGVLSWSSNHSSKAVDSTSLDDQHDQQEVLEVNGEIYKVVDLEEHLEKALLDFFEGSLKLTIQHRTRKHRI